jgi:uncharacterized protein with PIN domain
MSSASPKLQDEVPGELFFAVAAIGTSHAKPGESIYKSFQKAEEVAAALNKDREQNIIRRRSAAPVVIVFATFPRRKKDACRIGSGWKLVRTSALVRLTEEERLAHQVQEKLMNAGRKNE